MANITNGRLFRAYDELSSMLEKIPGGLAFDQCISRLPALRNLKKKEVDSLLGLIKSKGRIDVMETTQKGKVGSPVLRHRLHASVALTTAPEQTSVEVNLPHTGKTVFLSTPGKLTLDPKIVADMKRDVAIKENRPLTTHFERLTKELNTDTLGAIDYQASVAALGGKLDTIVADILKYLERRPTGATRTDINNKVMSYHAARGTDRAAVLANLMAYHGVVEQTPPMADARAAKILMHPKYIKTLPQGEKKFDHAAPTLSLDPVKPNYQPTSEGTLHLTRRVDDVMTFTGKEEEIDSITMEQVSEISELVLGVVKRAGIGGMAVSRVHGLVPEYHALSEDDRSRVMRYLVDTNEITAYRKGPNNILFVERTYSKTPTGLEESTVAAPVVTPKIQEPAQEESVMTNAPIGTSAEELRRQAALLNAQAEEIERRRTDTALLERVLPLHQAVVHEFQNVQAAITLQLDASAALGLAIEKLNSALLEGPDARN